MIRTLKAHNSINCIQTNRQYDSLILNIKLEQYIDQFSKQETFSERKSKFPIFQCQKSFIMVRNSHGLIKGNVPFNIRQSISTNPNQNANWKLHKLKLSNIEGVTIPTVVTLDETYVQFSSIKFLKLYRKYFHILQRHDQYVLMILLIKIPIQ